MPDPPQYSMAEAPRAADSSTQEDVLSPPFRCTCTAQGVEAALVKAFGDLDLAGVPELDAALRDALASAQLVVLDLSGLTFIDVAGVRAIVDASSRAVCDRRIIVAFAPAHVERTILLTGAAEAIERLDLGTSTASAGPHLRFVDSG